MNNINVSKSISTTKSLTRDYSNTNIFGNRRSIDETNDSLTVVGPPKRGKFVLKSLENAENLI